MTDAGRTEMDHNSSPQAFGSGIMTIDLVCEIVSPLLLSKRSSRMKTSPAVSYIAAYI